MFLQNKPTSRSRFFSFTSFGIFLCLVLVLLTALFLQVAVMVTPAREETTGHFLFFFLKVFSVAGAGLFVYSLFRISLPSKGRGDENASGNHAHPGFVMNTFEGMIQQLKAKEEELKRLKKKAEERAKRIESYNENILQSVPSGVMTFNCEKIITTFNVAAGTILDLSLASVLNRSYEEVFIKNKGMIQLLDTTLDYERDMLRQECVIDQADSKKIWLGLNTSLLRDRHDKIIGATLVFTDLTEKKWLEEQVALKKRLVMMGEMSGWIAHEFRNYMGTILGFSRLLEKKLEKSDTRQTMITSIIDEILAMEHLITELLSYSKKTVTSLSSVKLPQLFERIKEPFSENRRHADIHWSISFEEGFPEIELDPILMRQAFTNLVQNALDAMEGGGQIRINAFVRKPAKRVQIEISDTGIGIPEEALDKVFLPFFTSKNDGTGLGLALVHKIVLAHNGHITVESRKGEGTHFTIILPIKRQQINVKEPEWKQF